jgi:hypothetical protein
MFDHYAMGYFQISAVEKKSIVVRKPWLLPLTINTQQIFTLFFPKIKNKEVGFFESCMS